MLDGFDVTSWYVALAPAGTPRPIVDRLNTEIDAVMGGTAQRVYRVR